MIAQRGDCSSHPNGVRFVFFGQNHCIKRSRSSELLLSIPLTKRGQVSSAHEHTFSTSTPARSRSPRPSLSFVDPSPAPTPLRAVPVTPSPHPAVTDLHVESQAELGREAELEARDTDSLAVARACIGAREFLRAVHILKDRQSAKARFVSLYGQFLVRRLRDYICP